MTSSVSSAPAVVDLAALNDPFADDENKASNIAQETASSWDIIAKQSKKETPHVYEMLISYYNGSFSVSETQYLFCPLSYFQTIFELKPVRKIFKSIPTISLKNLDWSVRQTKEEKKKKDKNKKTGTADEIRERKTIKDFKDTFDSAISGEFGQYNIVESIFLNYISVIVFSYKEQNPEKFINGLLSLRDSFDYFSSNPVFAEHIHPQLSTMIRATLTHFEGEFPWVNFFEEYTKYLIKNHFSSTYQRASKPFPEQKDLIDILKQKDMKGENIIGHRSLFIAPWGVGCGKTSSVGAISYILNSVHGLPTFYCVPLGPIRDQTAANLLRCGVPFAYISRNGPDEFILQPSYNCANGSEPSLYIVDTDFMDYYIGYWKSCVKLYFGEEEDVELIDPFELMQMDISDNLPCIKLPAKRKYIHLNVRNDRGVALPIPKPSLWKYQYALIIDEPCESDPHLRTVLENLPETSFILSATSCDLIDEQIRQKYMQHNPEGQIRTVEAQTIGVSTTLIAYWLEDNPIITPFSGIQTRTEFYTRMTKLNSSILWRRFLSPAVLVHWIKNIRRQLPEDIKKHFSFEFELLFINFDQISKRIAEWSQILYEHVMEDAWYERVFSFGTKKTVSGEEMLLNILKQQSFRFTGGCIIASPSVYDIYRKTSFLLQDVPELQEIQSTVKDIQRKFVSAYKAIMGATYTSETISIKEHKLTSLKSSQIKNVPIDPSLVINTPEYIKKNSEGTHRNFGRSIRYSIMHPLDETGNIEEDPDGWNVELEVIRGVLPEVMRYKWVGLGSIIDNKEFYMYSIMDSDDGMVSFLSVDDLGAYGLNLKISNVILFQSETDSRKLSTGLCLQMAGRVGRIGQESTGYVYITSEELFHTLMA